VGWGNDFCGTLAPHVAYHCWMAMRKSWERFLQINSELALFDRGWRRSHAVVEQIDHRKCWKPGEA